jgi:hypothetical protein
LKATERLQVPQDAQDDARPQEVAVFIKAAGEVLDLGQQPQLQVNAGAPRVPLLGPKRSEILHQ